MGIVISPYGDVTTLTFGAGGMLTQATNTTTGTWQMQYNAPIGQGTAGLLSDLWDVRGDHHTFGWSSTGDLQSDTGPDGRQVTLSYMESLQADNRRVTTTVTQEGSVANPGQHQRTEVREERPGGGFVRSVTAQDGTVSRLEHTDDGRVIENSPTGVVSTTTRGADPRWPSQQRVATRVVTQVPVGGVTRTIATRSSRVSVPPRPLSAGSLVSITDTTERITPGTGGSPDVVVQRGGHDLRSTRVVERDTSVAGPQWAQPFRVTETSPMGRQSQVRLNSLNQPVAVRGETIVPGGGDPSVTLAAVTTTYDALGRVATVTQGSGTTARVVTYTYRSMLYPEPTWSRGRLASVAVSSTGATTMTTSYAYPDAQHTTVTRPDGTTVTTATNVPGDVTSITVPGGTSGRVHQFANMPAGRSATETAPAVTGQEDPATRTSTVLWRQDHAVTQVQRPGSAAYDYAYHDTTSGGPDGALRTETLPDVLGAGSRPTVSYAYRPATATPSSGNAALSSVEHSDGVRLSYEYDGPARRGETLSVLEGSTWTERGHVTRDPDDDLRVGTLRIGAGDAANDVVVPMSYDADGVPTQVGPMALTNDAATGVLLSTSAGVVTTAQRYTAFGELSALRSTRGMTAGLAFAYTYDPLGRLKVVTESDGGSTVSVRCYTYDTAGRLNGVYSASDAAMATCTGSSIATYGYDPNGNRVSSSGSATVSTSAATIDEQDRLTALTVGGVATTFAYTARGELYTRTAGTDVTTYRYDARGALASVTLPDASVVQYRNDPQGRRIERSYGGETRRWLYDGLRIVREEIGPTPSGGAGFAASVVRTFVYGTRGHVPDLVVQGSATYRVVTDHLGSVRQVVDTATGDVVAARSYDAWGRVTSDTTSSGFVALPQAYAGGIYDVQTGLVRFGARDYDSVLGRWTAKDPIGFNGGDSGLYGYVGGAPNRRVDSTGLCPWCLPALELFGEGVATLLADFSASDLAVLLAAREMSSQSSCPLHRDQDWSDAAPTPFRFPMTWPAWPWRPRLPGDPPPPRPSDYTGLVIMTCIAMHGFDVDGYLGCITDLLRDNTFDGVLH